MLWRALACALLFSRVFPSAVRSGLPPTSLEEGKRQGKTAKPKDNMPKRTKTSSCSTLSSSSRFRGGFEERESLDVCKQASKSQQTAAGALMLRIRQEGFWIMTWPC